MAAHTSTKKSESMTSVDQPYYIARSKLESNQGVLILPAWWGLNTFFWQLCTRLAKVGLVALALEHDHGKIASTVEEAEQLQSTIQRKSTL
jgi:dienelactone hydrolase